MMQIDENIRIFVEEHQKKKLKYIFADCLDIDPTFDKYKYDYEYCKKNAKWLFEEYKELTPLSQNKSDWNQKYWAEIKFDLENNFCDERFQHMVKVAQVVYKDKIERLKKERQSKSEKQRTEIEEKKRALEDENEKIEQQKQQQYEQFQSPKIDISASEKQRIEIEKKKRALEEENRRIEQQRQQQTYSQKQYKTTNGDSSKKALGVVLPIVLIVVVAGLVIKLLLL